MYFEHVKSYGDDHDCIFEDVIQEMASEYNVTIDPDEDGEIDLDSVLSMLEEKICEQGIEYYCDWNYNRDDERLEFNVFRVLVSSEEDLQRYCEIVRKEFTQE